ncbi:MAG: RNHCP domain-containing protein [Dehalococcoidia bacterium]
MAKTYRNRAAHPWASARSEEFRCRHCRMFVGSLPSGGRHRNHCPYCLYSRHLDGDTPGDRASGCGGSMAPVGAVRRPKGEHEILHRCLDCRRERYNRIAADDDFNLVLALPCADHRVRRRQRRGHLSRTA